MTRTVGVLGGMGPAATWDFCRRLQEALPAARDQDAPRVLVDCDPSVPDRNAAAEGGGPSPGPHLARMARGLERAGADLLCMPCNAAHAWAGDVRDAVRIPFVDMVASTVAAIADAAPDARRAGLLATTGTVRTMLYERALEQAGVGTVPAPAGHQEELMRLVYALKAGASPSPLRPRMEALARGLVAAGADVVIAACTEVPLLLEPRDVEVPLVESSSALAAAVARAATRTHSAR